MSQKGLAPILIVLLIVLVIGGILLYQKASLRQGSEGQAVQPSPSPVDETANWKTYRNTLLGYEFKYPDVPLMLKELHASVEITQNIDSDELQASCRKFGIQVFADAKNLQSGDILKSPSYSTKIAGVPAQRSDENIDSCFYSDILLIDPLPNKLNDLVIKITSRNDANTNLIQKILSTFKFLDQK